MAGPTLSQPSRARRTRRTSPMSEINVTPFVDVMLVLLIVFMVTAPLLAVGVPVDLPRAEAGNISDPEEPLVVSVTADGLVYVQERAVSPEDELIPLLIAITQANPEARIFLRGDQSINYGRVVEVMGAISNAGFTRVSLVAELPTPAAAP